MLITSDTPGANDSGNSSGGNSTAPSDAPSNSTSNSTSSQQEGECKDVPAPGSYSCQQQKGERWVEAGVGGRAGGRAPSAALASLSSTGWEVAPSLVLQQWLACPAPTACSQLLLHSLPPFVCRLGQVLRGLVRALLPQNLVRPAHCTAGWARLGIECPVLHGRRSAH